MQTWKLWRALHTPPATHPLFGRLCGAAPDMTTRAINWLFPTGMILLLLLFAVGLWYNPRLIFPFLLHPNFVFTTAILLFTGTVYGVFWAGTISATIARVRDTGQYDLLSLSHSSEMDAHWTICTGTIYRDDTFARVAAQRAWIVRLLIMLPGVAVLPLILGLVSASGDYVVSLLITIVHVVVIGLAFYTDHVQSAVQGALVGMIIPRHARSAVDARAGAGFAFLLLQAGAYTLALIMDFIVLPGLYVVLAISGLAAIISLPFVQLVVFYLCREVIITGLWYLLTRQLGATANLNALTP